MGPQKTLEEKNKDRGRREREKGGKNGGREEGRKGGSELCAEAGFEITCKNQLLNFQAIL